MAICVRFECGREDKISKEYGPYEFVQLTYSSLRDENGVFLAYLDMKHDVWYPQVKSEEESGAERPLVPTYRQSITNGVSLWQQVKNQNLVSNQRNFGLKEESKFSPMPSQDMRIGELFQSP